MNRSLLIRFSPTPAVAALAGLLLVLPAHASVESELQAALVGRHALTRGVVFSECTDHFTNLKVVAGRLAGGLPAGGGVRFEAGEMVSIDKVTIGTFSGLDVNLTISEPYLHHWEDGPFTVYEVRRCRAQLNFDVGRDVRRDRVKSMAAIEAVLELAPGNADETVARKLESWNKRRVQPFPKDWEGTRVEYEKYRVGKRNELVRKKTEEVLEAAAQVLRYMDSDDEYLLSFAEGAKAHSESWTDCDAMLRATFASGGSSGQDYEGWADGQKVAWATQLAEELQDCYLDPAR